jgi:glycosyltransferase involved in cell wall biosynthesis
MGQTPPPWHGQAVATQILFEHAWPGLEVHRLRMEFSEEMEEVGRFQLKKIKHLWDLIRGARLVLKQHPGTVLLYPPASAKWIPFLRDVVFLTAVRHLAGSTVFIFHASGLPVFVQANPVTRLLGLRAYRRPEVSLEVAKEIVPPHQVFGAGVARWCPCAIDVPECERPVRRPGSPFVALFVGSLQEGKGVLEILRTAAILKSRGMKERFRFRIVGRWFSKEFETQARALHRELGVENMVDFVGQLTGEGKWNAYAEADVFFFPTHYESEATPIVIMEALGMGCRILSTEWAGIPAMLEGCETATLLPVRSPDAYADTLVQLEACEATPQTALLAKEYYRNHYLPERFIERVNDAFHTAVELRADVGPSDGKADPARSAVTPAVIPAAAVTKADGDKWAGHGGQRPTCDPPPQHRNTETAPQSTIPTLHSPITLTIYLADQNPGHDRSYGISRMSQVVVEALQKTGRAEIETVTSKTSQKVPAGDGMDRVLPWGTRRKWARLLTDHFHPLFDRGKSPAPGLYYFPKGYLPLMSRMCSPSVVTIHDTIIQYHEDHYAKWRSPWEYRYWAWMLKHTLRHAKAIMTVSGTSKLQIERFMARHGLPAKKIVVTYEPCQYESIPQPEVNGNDGYVIHLASREPHKRTAQLVRWWHDAERTGRKLPMLHLVGNFPDEIKPLLASSKCMVKRPFLNDEALQSAYLHARALILPSEIEGFGLPALEAYYLGTPVCFVKGTSVEEVLSVATEKGGFNLDDPESFFRALEETLAIPAEEVRACGLRLRDVYAAEKVAERMLKVFEEVAAR